jgi:hypothetical protein
MGTYSTSTKDRSPCPRTTLSKEGINPLGHLQQPILQSPSQLAMLATMATLMSLQAKVI